VDDRLKWATEGADYLRRARASARGAFNTVMEEFKGIQHRGQNWFHEGKSCISAIYHYSEEFADDPEIPGTCFSSPEQFSRKLDEYEAFVESMQESMHQALARFTEKTDLPTPYEATDLLDVLDTLITAIRYVKSTAPKQLGAASKEVLTIVERAAVRFHESVLALERHPHGGVIYAIEDEWDCQYIFKVILAALFSDIRMEEWNPSVAGTSSRCEFYLKSHRMMIELKHARKKRDGKLFKAALALDFVDYGGNPQVDVVVVLIYDPGFVLDNAVQLQTDLSGPRTGMKDVRVIVSPPRSLQGI
jgi:hypothetical protein